MAEVEAMEKMVKSVEKDEQKQEEEVVEKAIVLLEKPRLQTIITDKWQTFEDDEYCFSEKAIQEYHQDPLPLVVSNQPVCYTMPDLITF